MFHYNLFENDKEEDNFTKDFEGHQQRQQVSNNIPVKTPRF